MTALKHDAVRRIGNKLADRVIASGGKTDLFVIEQQLQSIEQQLLRRGFSKQAVAGTMVLLENDNGVRTAKFLARA